MLLCGVAAYHSASSKLFFTFVGFPDSSAAAAKLPANAVCAVALATHHTYSFQSESASPANHKGFAIHSHSAFPHVFQEDLA